MCFDLPQLPASHAKGFSNNVFLTPQFYTLVPAGTPLNEKPNAKGDEKNYFVHRAFTVRAAAFDVVCCTVKRTTAFPR